MIYQMANLLRADLAQGSTVFTINGNSCEAEIGPVLEKRPPVVDRLRGRYCSFQHGHRDGQGQNPGRSKKDNQKIRC